MSLKIATEFAALLDNNEFGEASELLAENCTYHYFEGDYQGRQNIINVYRMNYLQSKRIFDEMSYTSSVEEMAGGTYKIDFVDKIRKGQRWHEYRCYQVVSFSDNHISCIQHSEIPGEIESLRLFFSRASVDKTNPS
ncbi:MAG: hypothetical protein ACHQM6_09335 [Candidatus Kapaibacterium sp.]